MSREGLIKHLIEDHGSPYKYEWEDELVRNTFNHSYWIKWHDRLHAGSLIIPPSTSQWIYGNH